VQVYIHILMLILMLIELQMYMISGSFFIIFMVVIVTFELCQVLCLRFLLQDLSFLIERTNLTIL
jgi:hypothetical protein